MCPQNAYENTYRPVLDSSSHRLGRLRVEPDGPGAVDEAVVLDGLRELGERLGGLSRQDAFDLAHFRGGGGQMQMG